jgi:hypothetical protein
MAVVANEIERRHAVVVASNRLPIDDAGARVQPGERINDQREATSEVIARTAVEAHSRAVLPGDNPKAVSACRSIGPEPRTICALCLLTLQGARAGRRGAFARLCRQALPLSTPRGPSRRARPRRRRRIARSDLGERRPSWLVAMAAEDCLKIRRNPRTSFAALSDCPRSGIGHRRRRRFSRGQ